tara:strand:+ start:586 stop:918 length:333 start_codon:yes stop_codon:yes gene_type:complete
MIDLEEQSYTDWKADRQAYLDNRSAWQVAADERAYAKYNSDEGYYGLADDIASRQASKIPIPGEGSVIFLGIASAYTRPLARLGWPGLLIHGIFKTADTINTYQFETFNN